MSAAIKEQGPKNYEAMRARMPAEPVQEAQAAERSTAEVARLVADLTGDKTPLFVPSGDGCGGVTSPTRAVSADVENDGDRGPRPSVEAMVRRTLTNELQAFGASAPLDDVRVLAAMVRELPGLRLLATCEALTARGLRGAGESEGMPATTLRETMVASMLSTWRLFQRGVLPGDAAPGEKASEWPASHLPRRTIGDYIHGRVAVPASSLPAKDGAK